jgi:hypothetical protein
LRGILAPEEGDVTDYVTEINLDEAPVAAFLGWGDKTIITKTAADFTKKQLLEAVTQRKYCTIFIQVL